MKKKLFLPLFIFLFSQNIFSQDQGMTSETHRKNVGKILWAKERILMNKQDQIKYANQFDASDPLYGRIYLEKSLPRSAEGQGVDCENYYAQFKLKVFINDVDKGYINEANFINGQSWTTAQVNLNLTPGDKSDDANRYVPEKWKEMVNKLNDGSHDVKFVFYGGGVTKCLLKLAEGSFVLNKKGEVTSGVLKKLPEAKMKNATLENEMLGAIKKHGWKNEVPIKVVIIEPDWRVIRNSFGAIIRKEINTNVVLKKNDGTCRLTDISFERPYRGNNNYGATEVYGIGLKNIPFDCNAVK